MIALEFFQHVLSKQMEEFEVGYFNPYTDYTRVSDPRVRPTHYTTEGGGHYSARPDLTRSGGPGTYRAGGAAMLVLGSAVGAGVITKAYGELIADESPDERRRLWQFFG